MTRDIHCVTSWSKLNTAWEGITVDDILADAGLTAPAPFALAHCYDGYSTNVPLADLASGKAMVALKYEGQPLPRDHGGPARTTRAASLLLEVGEVGERSSVHGPQRGRLLGAARVPHVRRSVE